MDKNYRLSNVLETRVCWLSHSTTLAGSSGSKQISAKMPFQAIISFAAWDRASNSASVVEVVTVSYFRALQSTGPENNCSKYPSVLFFVCRSFAKDASLDALKILFTSDWTHIRFPLNSMAKYLQSRRYAVSCLITL